MTKPFRQQVTTGHARCRCGAALGPADQLLCRPCQDALTGRDPRWDPAPGDLLTRGRDPRHFMTRQVTAVQGDRVDYLADGQGCGVKHGALSCGLQSWRDWARRAAVVKRGIDPDVVASIEMSEARQDQALDLEYARHRDARRRSMANTDQDDSA
jgi:hypothetical protein